LLHRSHWGSVALLFALGSLACSSDDSTAQTTTGTTTSGTGQGGSGGSSGPSTTTTTSASGGSGGSSTGNSGSGGTPGAGGSTGGNAGSAGSAGSNGGAGASSKDGGAGSAGAPNDGGSRDGTGMSDVASGFALTSSAFMEGGMFPTANTCTGGSLSPALSWTPGPAARMSYAIVLTDKTNMLRHWVLWDIPPGTMSLSANLAKTATLTMPAGAKQVSIATNGYAGPCPPAGTMHTYEFALYAIDVAMLPGVTTTSMPMAVEAAVLAHQLAKTTLTGQGMQ
jgi:Raf kinase inhibitor-like YbhB/YbcL family protein